MFEPVAPLHDDPQDGKQFPLSAGHYKPNRLDGLDAHRGFTLPHFGNFDLGFRVVHMP